MKAADWWRRQPRSKRVLVGGGIAALLLFLVLPKTAAGAVVALARKQIGLRELPMGSNGGPEIMKFTGGRDESWCAHFVAWVFRNAGYPLPNDALPSPNRAVPLASVRFFIDMAKSMGRFLPPGSTPRPGDVIFYGSHTGIVVGFDRGTDKVETVEGNFSDKVVNTRVPRTSSTIKGFGRFV